MLRWRTGSLGSSARAFSHSARASSACPPERRSEPRRKWAVASFGFDLQRPAEDDEGLGTVREDVAGGLARGEGEVLAPGAARLLGAVAAVVRDERVVLRQGRPRLGHDAGRRVAAGEERVGVVPEPERHVVDGQLEDAFRVGGEVRPQRLVRGAEEDRLVTQEGARRVHRPPVREAAPLASSRPARAAQQGHLHPSRADHLGRLRQRLPDEPQALQGVRS